MGRRIILSIALAGLAACHAAARTVTVASCDRSTGATTLAISAAEAGDGAKALVAAWSPSDVGNAVTNASNRIFIIFPIYRFRYSIIIKVRTYI